MERKKYSAFTLLEMLLVIGILVILGAMTFASFDGLQNTIKMNEYMLNLEQDARAIQRASMLLERNPMENWLYGVGIDFTDMNPDGNYTTFKWCTPFEDYGDITTRSKVPGYDPNPDTGIDSTSLPLVEGEILGGICDSEVGLESELRRLFGYETIVTMPKGEVEFETNARIVVFESVSGRAFFYDEEGKILNYSYEEETGRLEINDAEEIEDLIIVIDTLGGAATRRFTIKHLSGRVEIEVIR